MSKTVTIRFAGEQPCRDCGSTTSQRGWISRTDEVVCANSATCASRLKLRAVLKAEKCDCTKGQWERRESCTQRIVRCRGRQAWKAQHDEKFRRVWAGWMGIPTLKQQEREKRRGSR